MKRLIIISIVLLVFSVSAHAGMDMAEDRQSGMEKGMTGKEQQMFMMHHCMTMMGQMMEMQEVMGKLINVQEKILRGTTPAEKKKMIREMEEMKRHHMMRKMMGHPEQTQIIRKCAAQWLKKALDLHELHMKDPKTATEASQRELMEQIKRAYDCITAPGCKMMKTLPEELESKETKTEKPPEADLH
jgi:hypothetical protein